MWPSDGNPEHGGKAQATVAFRTTAHNHVKANNAERTYLIREYQDLITCSLILAFYGPGLSPP